MENISFNSGTNKFILTYDIGQEADGIQSQAKVYSVSSDSAGTSVTLAGTLPYPTDPAKTPVISSALLSSVTLESIVSVSDATDGFNVQFTIDNSSGTSLDIEEIKPKVYLDGISGQDITYQFTSTQTRSMTIPLQVVVVVRIPLALFNRHLILMGQLFWMFMLITNQLMELQI